MRVISGTARGRQIKAPPGSATRPTADRVRESIFNILGTRCVDARVVDLFAGAGTMGIEALSRGAADAVFVENNRKAAEVIKGNLGLCGMDDSSRLMVNDVFRGMESLARAGEIFDLIFVDPPYGKELAAMTLERLGRGDLCQEDGLVVVEYSRHDLLKEEYGVLRQRRTERYGETMVSFYAPVSGAKVAGPTEG